MMWKKKKKPAAPKPPKEPKVALHPVTATIDPHSPIARQMTALKNKEFEFPLVFPSSIEPPIDLDYSKAVWTFNVSTLSQKIERPNAPGGSWIIHGRGTGEKFGRGPTFPEYFNEITVGRGERHIRRIEGRFIAQDIINPEQPFGDIHTADPGQYRYLGRNINTNLYDWGCFWSGYPEPSKEELALAHRRLTGKCLSLIREAQLFWLETRRDGDRRNAAITATHKFAAGYLDIKFEWL
jgi:hypothetical protein